MARNASASSGVGFGAQVHLPGVPVGRLGSRGGVQPQSRQGAQAARCRGRRGRAHRSARADHARRHRRRRDQHAAGDASSRSPIAALNAGKHVALREAVRDRRATRPREMRDAARAQRPHGDGRARVPATRRSARYIKQLLAEGYIGKFQLCTIELFLDRYVTRAAAAADVAGLQGGGRRHCSARSARTTSMGCATGSAKSPPCTGQLATLRPDVLDRRRRSDRQGRNRRHVPVHAAIRERRHGDDDRVVRRDAGARRADRRHGRRRHADRRAGGAQSDGRRRRRRRAATARRCARSPTPAQLHCRSPTRAIIG